jgi:hypothetical protein
METTYQFKKLLSVICACFVGISAEAQITCSRTSMAGNFDIHSTADYTKAQDSVQVLAYSLYTLYQQYPEFTYVHHVDEQGKIAAISVVGIPDTDHAVAAASRLMSLEILGEAIRTMDPAVLPKTNSATREKKMNEQETLKYQPAPRLPKDKKSNTPVTFVAKTDL